MALERTWSAQAVNQVPADETTIVLLHKSLMFAMKQFITGASPAVAGGAWTVQRSSDGTTAGAGDNWGSSFDANKIKWHADGNARSWIVYESPDDFVQGGKVYLLFDLIGSGSDASTHQIYHEMSSTPYTGGSVTARPSTAATPSQINNGGVLQWYSSSLGSAHKWHGTRNTHGDWAWFASKDGQQFMQTSFFHIALEDHEPTDDYASLGHIGWNEGAPGAPSTSTYQPGTLIALWAGGNRPATGNNCQHVLQPVSFNSTGFLGTIDGGGSDISGNYYQWALETATLGGNNNARRGRAVDIAMCQFGSAVTQVTGTPSGTFEKIILGISWFPFSTKPTLT